MDIRDTSGRTPGPRSYQGRPPDPVDGVVIRLALKGAAWPLLGIVAGVAWGAFVALLIVRKALLSVFAGGAPPADDDPGALVLLGACAAVAAPVFACLFVQKARAARRLVIGATAFRSSRGAGRAPAWS